ncbi:MULTISPECIES: PH domain-containing protein [unclassified Curtobacterium]|uniref:PH domain-containing protein n=1 Tax=unclassified Curtobacterium TaxID=257496 RepID=UPI000F4B2A32|nr:MULTISPECIES: PH domain-containing protein [unclassified Curtobacterium]ROP64654.1 PH (Pleckstrin Homology) domain-containing protein [Curtobacterium sp. ZW137]TCK63567.1 PH (Pleckstrin Homology) domain-containing protein [Curtobacterium sp. PhB136]
MSDSPTPEPARIVAPGMRTLAVVLWVVAVVLVVLGFVGRGDTSAWLVPVPSVFVAFVAWAVLWRPRLELTADALVVVDVRRTSTYAWPRVTGVRTKYGLEIQSNEPDRRTWIAPRPTARLRVDRPGGSVPVSVDAAAAEVLAFVPEAAPQDGPPPASVARQPITHRLHGWSVLAMIVLGIAASLSAARL